MSHLVTAAKAARLLDCSTRSVQRMARDGRLKALRVGRVLLIHHQAVARLAAEKKLPILPLATNQQIPASCTSEPR